MGSEHEFCHSLNTGAENLSQWEYVDAILQRELADRFEDATSKTSFLEVFTGMELRKWVKKKIYTYIKIFSVYVF